MTVNELIEMLKEHDGENEVLIQSAEISYYGLPVLTVEEGSEVNSGKLDNITFIASGHSESDYIHKVR